MTVHVTPETTSQPTHEPAPKAEPTGAAEPRPMSSAVRALIAVNAALLIALSTVVLSPDATAQNTQNRPAGRYMLVGGKPPSGNTNAVYCVDTVNGEMIVLGWNRSRGMIEGVGYRNIKSDLNATPRR
ncbi:MAG: hypothetical protein AAGI53_01880 [Planctomycetota bacterium]